MHDAKIAPKHKYDSSRLKPLRIITKYRENTRISAKKLGKACIPNDLYVFFSYYFKRELPRFPAKVFTWENIHQKGEIAHLSAGNSSLSPGNSIPGEIPGCIM